MNVNLTLYSLKTYNSIAIYIIHIKIMADSSFREVIKEVVIKLRLPIGVYIDATKYCSQLKDSKTHDFSTEVLEAASTYLATKVNEEYRRIRGNFSHFTHRHS